MALTLTSPDTESSVATIPLKQIKLSGGTQPREMINNDLIAEYAEEMLGGVQFPPVTLYYDGSDYWPSDGFHRIKAAQKARRESIAAHVVQGTRRDAVLASFSATAGHGLRRSNADKRRGVTRMLEDDEWTRMSDAAIARCCCVSDTMVSNLRIKLGITAPSVKTVTWKGKSVVMNTSGITTSKKKKQPPVLETPSFERPVEIQTKTKPTLFESFLKTIKNRGVEAKTHVRSDFGAIDIETDDCLFIIAGAMTASVFRDAFVTLLFQRQHSSPAKRAVIVGTTSADLIPWVKEAKRLGVDVLEYSGS